VRPWIAAAAILALQLTAGCALVTVGEPVGEVAPLSKKEWEGLWLSDSYVPFVVLPEDIEKGILQICTLREPSEKERATGELGCFAANVRKVQDELVLCVAADEFLPYFDPFAKKGKEFRESLKGRWLLFLLDRRKSRAIVWWFKGKEAADLIDQGKLRGTVHRKEWAPGKSSVEEVRIDRLEPELLKRWMSEDSGEFLWKKPFIFDRYPLGE
jgi:hypothetical protein